MRDALKAFGGDPDKAGSIRADNVAAFVEAHIEQGPVLEAEGLPLGVVTAINGATRLEVGVDGTAGHAGATPMALRRDALTAAAEMALAIEARARDEADLVATVGRLEVWPGATNVIPGHVQFSVDLRAPDDARRAVALADLKASIHSIAAARGVSATSRKRTRPRLRLRSAHRRGADAGGRAGRRKAPAPAVGGGARHDGHGSAVPGGHAVRPLQGRHQPQSAGIDHARGLRVRTRGADPLRARIPHRLSDREDTMTKRFFGDIGPVRYEGPKSDNPFAFRHYDPARVVMGKTMAEHLRPAVCYWHNFGWMGSDMFGSPTFERPWNNDDMKGGAAQGRRRLRHVLDPRLPVLRLPRQGRRSGRREPRRIRAQPRGDDRHLRRQDAVDRA